MLDQPYPIMKRFLVPVLALLALLLVNCSGSETYRGHWKAMTPEGKKVSLLFEAKKFSVTDSSHQVQNYEYSQNSVEISGSVETYGIKLDDGRRYQIHFPLGDDESIGLIKDESGQVIFTIGRNDYITEEDIYKLD